MVRNRSGPGSKPLRAGQAKCSYQHESLPPILGFRHFPNVSSQLSHGSIPTSSSTLDASVPILASHVAERTLQRSVLLLSQLVNPLKRLTHELQKLSQRLLLQIFRVPLATELFSLKPQQTFRALAEMRALRGQCAQLFLHRIPPSTWRYSDAAVFRKLISSRPFMARSLPY